MGTSIEDTSFSGYSKDIRYLDIYNIGYGSFDWKLSADKDWVTFSKAEGSVYSDDRIWIGMDWDKVPEGSEQAVITVSEVIGDSVVSEKQFTLYIDNNVTEAAGKDICRSQWLRFCRGRALQQAHK